MVWSKRKPYYGLKLSVNEFFRAPVRYLREYITKESILEKPYVDGDRGEMHQDPPRNPDPFPPGDPQDYPPWDPTGPTDPGGDLPPPPLPGVNPGPDTPIPGINPDPDPTGGYWVPSLCSSSGSLGCLSVGESGLIYAAANTSDGTAWRIENTDPGVVSAKIIKTLGGGAYHGDRIVIEVTALKEQEDRSATITIWGSWRDYESRCGTHYVTVPCCNNSFPIEWDYEISEETIVRGGNALVAVTQGTGPYTWAVTGTGFTISPETETRYNILFADETACGSATIVVTDACGSVAVGYVREEDNSQWNVRGAQNVCGISGAASWARYGDITQKDGTLIQGKYKTVVRIGSGGGANGCINCGSSAFPGALTCPEWCASVNCLAGIQCNECVTGYSITGYTQAGTWNCWGLTFVFPSCEAGLWRSMICACAARVQNYEWECS